MVLRVALVVVPVREGQRGDGSRGRCRDRSRDRSRDSRARARIRERKTKPGTYEIVGVNRGHDQKIDGWRSGEMEEEDDVT